jgi:hypothetical protein
MAETVKKLTIDPSPSPDVVGYRMYYVPVGEEIFTVKDNPDNHSPFILLDSSLTYDLHSIPAFGSLDGEYDVGFTAIDDASWESELGGLNYAVPFDFVPPEPPVGATFGIG